MLRRHLQCEAGLEAVQEIIHSGHLLKNRAEPFQGHCNRSMDQCHGILQQERDWAQSAFNKEKWGFVVKDLSRGVCGWKTTNEA